MFFKMYIKYMSPVAKQPDCLEQKNGTVHLENTKMGMCIAELGSFPSFFFQNSAKSLRIMKLDLYLKQQIQKALSSA